MSNTTFEEKAHFVEATATLNFDTCSGFRPLSSRHCEALPGPGALSFREAARDLEYGVRALKRNVTTLANVGKIDRTDVVFPYARIHFELDIGLAV